MIGEVRRVRVGPTKLAFRRGPRPTPAKLPFGRYFRPRLPEAEKLPIHGSHSASRGAPPGALPFDAGVRRVLSGDSLRWRLEERPGGRG